MEISAENMGQIDKRDWDDLRAYFRYLIQRSDDLFENWAFYRQSPSKKDPNRFLYIPTQRPKLGGSFDNNRRYQTVHIGFGPFDGEIDEVFRFSTVGFETTIQHPVFAEFILGWLILVNKVVMPLSITVSGVDPALRKAALERAGLVRAGLTLPEWLEGPLNSGVDEEIQRPDSMDFRA